MEGGTEVSMSRIGMTAACATLIGCSPSGSWFLDYETAIDNVDIASNASIVELAGFVQLERDGADWSCAVSASDHVVLDGQLTALESLTSTTYGDVSVETPDCYLDPEEFDQRQVWADLDVSYDIHNLVYGQGTVDMTLSVSLDRSESGTGSVFVSDALVCVDNYCSD